jgi:hypothetical protein
MQGRNDFSGIITYNDEQQMLEINGDPLQQNEQAEITVMGYWIAGC